MIEDQLALLYSKERRLREKSEIDDGKIVLNEVDSIQLQECEK